MKGFSKTWLAGLLGLALMLAGARTEAQFAFSASSSANVIGTSNSLTYTINVSNLTTGAFFAFVTNTFSSTALFLGTSNNPGPATVVTNANGISFNNVSIDSTTTPFQTMTVTVAPTQAGFFTNTVAVAILGVVTNFTTNLVAQVTTNAVTLPQADLAVAIALPTTVVITNDWLTYGINVTNLGPGDATGVFLTNTLPVGAGLKNVSPAGQSYNVVSSNVIFNLGTLTNQAFLHLLLTIQPTNGGTWNLVSVISTNNVFDPNPTNNSASNILSVTNYFPGTLVAVTNSPQSTNFQNGFIEQTILLSNVGANAVPAGRVVVTGLTTNRLYNAVGTNNGNPYVVYAASLDTNQSVNLLLQFSVHNRSVFPFGNSQLHAAAVPVPNLAPPLAAAVSTNINISRIIRRSNGSILLEWPSTTNLTYTVVYSDNVLFSNAMIAPPGIVAPANRTQWIDYGPPTTVSAPTNAPIRFYRIFQNP